MWVPRRAHPGAVSARHGPKGRRCGALAVVGMAVEGLVDHESLTLSPLRCSSDVDGVACLNLRREFAPMPHEVTGSTQRRGTPEAVALAIKLSAARVRRLGFKGSTSHLSREFPDGTTHLVHFQRMVSGVTGMEPSFTVNLNVVSGNLWRAWAASGDWRAQGPLRSGADIGVHVRLGHLALGQDYWWNPADEAEAVEVAETVADLVERFGLPWFEQVGPRA
jgi:hypothetical protein